jgi:hypothetical protein
MQVEITQSFAATMLAITVSSSHATNNTLDENTKFDQKIKYIFLVYAETADSCNTLDFQLGPTGIGTTIPTRQWNIRVSCFC